MKYAIVKIGGKQLKVTEGYTFEIERQNGVNLDVLYYTDGDEILVGDPFVKDVEVKASIEGESRGDKVRVARYRAKSRYHKVKGHKQPLSIVKVTSISKKASKVKEPKKEAPEKKENKSK
ncbi:MAG: 50S ribosomal protein L21 [Patescibacteria group bacterium]